MGNSKAKESDKKQAKLLLVHSFPVWLPQTQTWLYNQVKQLQSFGVETHVVCERTENLSQFSVNNIHSLENESFVRQTWEKGLRRLKVRRYLNFLAHVGRSIGTNIMHSHFGHIGWANLGAARKLNCKHVVTFYGLDVNQLPVRDPRWKTRYQRLFAEVDLFLCEGPYMAQSIGELGCDPNKIKVQHLGVDVENIEFQARQWHEGESLRILIAASFREKKGITYAIDALGRIAKEVPVRLTIIGDAGQEEEERQEKVKILAALERNELSDRTRLLGYQSHQVLLQEAYAHHLFLQPSVTASGGDTEGGAPVSIIEMMASGMPVVATTHCDIPEVVGPAGLHLLAPERDATAVADCIRSLLDDADDWSELARRGRRHVEQQFDVRQQAASLIDHYHSLIVKP